MKQFERISVHEAWTMLASSNGQAVLVDIRDELSYQTAHSLGAFHLTNQTVLNWMTQTQLDQPILVICYHGHSSQGVAQYLMSQGYEDVYSIDGGFAAWQSEGLPLDPYE